MSGLPASFRFAFLSVFALLGSPAAVAQETPSPSPVSEGLSATDGLAVRRVQTASRHLVLEDRAGGFLTRNPGQAWMTEFDGRGFMVRPDGRDWTWGLQLKSYGFAGQELCVSGQAPGTAQGGRLSYAWSDRLEEWYVNDVRGLEHGYTLARRPSTGQGPLRFELAVLGDLRAQVSADARSVAFTDGTGQAVLNYAGLLVFDALGEEQPAMFAATGNSLTITVHEAGAVYPLTIDPIAQQAYLKASNSDSLDQFGWSVDVSGDWAVVGADGERSNATGVNGDQTDNSLNSAGAAYVFQLVNGQWIQVAYLKPSNLDSGDAFGQSVAISGNLIVVGAPWEDSNSTTVDGDQTDNSSDLSGAVYVFERTGSTWSQVAYLKAFNNSPEDLFGRFVAISGELIAVSAIGEDSRGIGINGYQFGGALNSGAVYLFQRNAGVWASAAYVKASNTDEGDTFGAGIALSDDRLVVGAPHEDSDGSQGDNSLSNVGAAYVFERVAGAWAQVAYLKHPSLAQSRSFGVSAALSGDLIVLGASNSAHVFERTAGSWTYDASLIGLHSEGIDLFGYRVAIAGDRVVVSASREASGAVGVNGDQTDNRLSTAGAAYVFERTAGTWSQTAYLKASNPGMDDHFAYSMGASGDRIIVGAPFEDSNARGVDGDQLNDSAHNSGAAYIFDLDVTAANFCGLARANSAGFSTNIFHSGSTVAADNAFALHAQLLPTGVFGYFLSSTEQGYTSSPGKSAGVFCLGSGAAVGRHHISLQNSGASGSMDYIVNLTAMPGPLGSVAVQAGETWNFQCWYRDQTPGHTSNFSDGLSVQFQ